MEGKHAIGFAQTWLKKGQVVVKAIRVLAHLRASGCVAVAAKARAITLFAACGAGGLELGTTLRLARVEWWVYIDEIYRSGIQGAQEG